MDDVVAFLTARLDDQLNDAKELDAYAEREDAWGMTLRSVADNLRADVAAKRAIIALHQPRRVDLRPRVVCMTCATSTRWSDADEYPCVTIKMLAMPYAEHPDYNAFHWGLSA